MKMQYAILALCLWAINMPLEAQVTLQDCQNAAIKNSPLQAQAGLYASRAELKQASLQGRNLPRMVINGQATYQSDVIFFPSPGFPDIPNFQYRASLDLEQPLYQGGLVSREKALNEAQARTEEKQVEASIYPLRNRVNQIYFAILLTETQQAVLTASQEQLQQKLEAIQAAIEHGTALPSAASTIEKEILSLGQQIHELRANNQAFRQMLSTLTGQAITSGEPLTRPDSLVLAQQLSAAQNTGPRRPELELFDRRQSQLALTSRKVGSRLLPKIYAFASGILGQPNQLNFADTEFAGNYIVGLRLSWQPWDWNQTSKEREILQVQQQVLETQKQDFDRNLTLRLTEARYRLESLSTLIADDIRIMELQDRIVATAATQLENGVITTTDYLDELTALTRAQLSLEQHRLRYVQTQAEILTELGTFNLE